MQTLGFPGGSEDKAPACNAGDPGWEDHLEKEMAVHSSILAWRIPWREEPGGLQSMRLQESDMTEQLNDNIHTYIHTHTHVHAHVYVCV